MSEGNLNNINTEKPVSAGFFFLMGFSLLSASEFLQTEKWRCAKQ